MFRTGEMRTCKGARSRREILIAPPGPKPVPFDCSLSLRDQVLKLVLFRNTFCLEISTNNLESIIFCQELGSLLVRVEDLSCRSEENDAGRHTIDGVLQIVCSRP